MHKEHSLGAAKVEFLSHVRMLIHAERRIRLKIACIWKLMTSVTE